MTFDDPNHVHEHNYRKTTGGDAICFGCGSRLTVVGGEPVPVLDDETPELGPERRDPESMTDELEQLGFSFGEEEPPDRDHLEVLSEPVPGMREVPVDYVVSDTLNSAEGIRRRDEALARVDENAEESWKAIADAAIYTVASRESGDFTTDQIWDLLDAWGIPKPHEPRALGPRMNAAVKDGIIERTDRYRKTERPIAHAAPTRIYRRGENVS